MSITLIGMAGAGKSFVGKKVADALSYSFIDLDKKIEAEHDKKLQEVLDALGEQAFIETETAVAIRAAGLPRTVISPGGSIVYSDAAIEALRAHTTVIYLSVPYEVIRERVGEVPRGIVGLGNKSLKELYEERLPLYEHAAHFTIDGDRDADEVAASILEKISEIPARS